MLWAEAEARSSLKMASFWQASSNQGAAADLSSISVEKESQLAFFRLEKERSGEESSGALKVSVRTTGTWSELSAVTVVQSREVMMLADAKEMSGEVGRPLRGTRVGESSLRQQKSELLMASAKASPLVSGSVLGSQRL